jgi:uroporphyrinogen-III decarboxylase
VRERRGAYFVETLEIAVPEGVDPYSVEFESPTLESRYLMGRKTWAELLGALGRDKVRHCVFAKTGGPFLRTTFVRGESQFLVDIAQDPSLARALAERVGAHIAAVGVEEIRRWSLQETGIWIYDDMAYNDAPLFSPKAFETIFLPTYRRMIRAYREAGARYVFLHSDGNVMPFLDMLVDAGIDGLHPLERRAGMDPFALRKRYPRLVLAGGLCNTDVLLNGPVEKIKDQTRRLIDLGRDGGVIVGTHSISPEVPVEHYLAYDEACRQYGDFGG